MKRIFSVLLCYLLVGALITPASAAETDTVIFHQETDCGNGVTMVDEVIEHSQIRSSTKDILEQKRFDTTELSSEKSQYMAALNMTEPPFLL